MTKFNRRRIALASVVMALAGLAGPALAQGVFPSKTITMIVPFPPGGVVDPVARILAPKLSLELGQPVVIDNRAGAGGIIGTAAAGRAEPDGHTILLTTGSVSVHPNMLKNPGYDVRKDLVPVSLIASGPYTIAINTALPIKTLPEFLSYARANPGKVFYGSAGNGSSTHLIGELFNSMAGTKLVHVPYRGNGPMMTALMTGDIQIGFDTVPGSKALAEGGKVNLLAVTSEARNVSLPKLPPATESGIPNFEVTLWEAFFLPKGTPEPIVARWNAALKKVLEAPDVQKRLVDFGFDVVGSTPRELRTRIDADITKWANVIKAANIATE